MNEDTAIAWAAGLFEGEGCITGNKNVPNLREIKIKMTDKDVMQRFVDIVGYGNLRGPYTQRNRPSTKPFWVWAIGKRLEVVRILTMFLPYFGERRSEKAIEAITHFETIN